MKRWVRRVLLFVLVLGALWGGLVVMTANDPSPAVATVTAACIAGAVAVLLAE